MLFNLNLLAMIKLIIESVLVLGIMLFSFSFLLGVLSSLKANKNTRFFQVYVVSFLVALLYFVYNF